MPDERFTDNQNGTITDNQTGLTWTSKDTWQMNAQWVTFDEAHDFSRDLVHSNFGGFSDWRLPKVNEVKSLYDPSQSNKDKYGKDIYLSNVFPEGPQSILWCDESMSGNDGYIFNFQSGELTMLHKSKCPRMAARGVRGEILKD